MDYLYFILLYLASFLVGCFITRRIYRRKLATVRAQVRHSWAAYEEVSAMAARWKRLYYNLQGRA